MKFEYKTFQVKLDDSDLNKLGDQGWELVSHTAVVLPLPGRPIDI